MPPFRFYNYSVLMWREMSGGRANVLATLLVTVTRLGRQPRLPNKGPHPGIS